ncbi:MAG: Crp/Fnr family transcriptional regulator [Pseudomonadota bacterium]
MNWSDLLDVAPNDPGVELLDKNTTAQTVQRNEILIHQDSVVGQVYLVSAGLLQAKFVSFEGAEVWLANLGPGAVTGEISALCDRLSSANVEAAEKSEVLAVPRAVFLRAMSQSSAFAVAISRMLAGRIADTSNSLTSHVALKIEYRLLNALKLMAGSTAQATEIRVAPPPSVSELAVRIHASREATSRAFTRLLKRGVLEKRQREILVYGTDRNRRA